MLMSLTDNKKYSLEDLEQKVNAMHSDVVTLRAN